MKCKEFYSCLVCLALLVSSGCLAAGCDTWPEEVGYRNSSLIEDLAKDAGLTIMRDEMPYVFLAEGAKDETSFLRKTKERNATTIYVIETTQENPWTKKIVYKEKRYMAVGDGGKVVFEKRYLDPDYPRLSENESAIFYDQQPVSLPHKAGFFICLRGTIKRQFYCLFMCRKITSYRSK